MEAAPIIGSAPGWAARRRRATAGSSGEADRIGEPVQLQGQAQIPRLNGEAEPLASRQQLLS